MEEKKEVIMYDNLMPVSLKGKYYLADQIFKSGMAPKSLNSASKVMVALQMGHELGLKPMIAVNNITVINGKPTLSADLITAIIMNHPEYAGMNIESSDIECTITIKRKGKNIEDEFNYKFTLDDAKRAGLLNKDVWMKYPKRMLKHRAISYCGRDAFPDAIAGIYLQEEMENITEESTVKNITPENEPMATAEEGAMEKPVALQAIVDKIHALKTLDESEVYKNEVREEARKFKMSKVDMDIIAKEFENKEFILNNADKEK